MMRLGWLLPLLLAACGALPEPFYGNPGPEAARLAVPPPPVLMIPPPSHASLGDAAAKTYAADLAAALVALDVPSIAGPARPGEWQLLAATRAEGTTVVPVYAVLGPDGKTYGKRDGAAIAAGDWQAGDPQVLLAAAAADAAPLRDLLARVNASVQQSNPQSLENRPARVYLGPVSGAPTDGDAALALNMGRDLPGEETVLTRDPARADFRVSGTVKAEPDAGGQMLVQLTWTVRDANDRVVGQVTQLHELKPADITPYWGDVAVAAAAEGASGIQQVIRNATLHPVAKANANA